MQHCLKWGLYLKEQVRSLFDLVLGSRTSRKCLYTYCHNANRSEPVTASSQQSQHMQ
uniref:Uncharacterized protein n=1 Tax=Anguilla anguilla TaxID=7936 RepID=A0A0E9WKB7_ANGAN